MIEEHELPDGWFWTTIGRIAETTSGGTPSRNYPEYYNGTIPWIKSGELEDSTIVKVEEFLTEEGVKNSSAKIVREGTVLVAMYGATVGKTGILSFDATTNQAICALSPLSNAFIAKFMMYWLQVQRQNLIEQSVGGAQPNINQGIVRSLSFPLAPLPEQQRIVAAIEQQFTRLDAGVAALKSAQTRLKRYRAAVLKAAVEGKLTEAWRAEHPTSEPASQLLTRILQERRAKWEADLRAKGKDPAKVKYVEPAAPDVSGLPELSEGWCWATVEQVSRFVRYGTSAKTSEDTNGVPILRMGNIQIGALALDNLKYLPENHSEFPDLLLQKGDLLFNRTNSPELVGKSAVYQGNFDKCSYASYLICVRTFSSCSTDYLSFFLNSWYGRIWVASVVTQQVGQANVNGSKLQALTFPLPPFEEQQQIVSEVERRLSVVSKLEAMVETNLKRAKRLRQSILKEAFAGRLVEQDPDDEPASVLLERIRKEREAQEGRSEQKGRKQSKVQQSNGYKHPSSEQGNVQAASMMDGIQAPEHIDVDEVEQIALWSAD